MNKKIISGVILSAGLLFSGTFIPNNVAAATNVVMWGKMQLVNGQIGKVTILQDTSLYKIGFNGKMTFVRTIKNRSAYRVYSVSKFGGITYYGVGAGCYVKASAQVKYETPSKALLAKVNGTPSTTASNTQPVNGQIGKVTILQDTTLYKLGSNKQMTFVRTLKKGSIYRVYSVSNFSGVTYYGVGAGCYVKANSQIKYETQTPTTNTNSSSKYSAIAIKVQQQYKQEGFNWHNGIMDSYDSNGKYFNGTAQKYGFNKDIMTMDANGIIMVKYSGGYQYNPVTIAQYALSNYGSYLDTKDDTYKNTFLKYAQALINVQGQDGALRYNFTWKTHKPGWVSAMAQGEALSVYARAYYLTGNQKYLYYGNKAFRFMNTNTAKGGTLTTLEPLNKNYKNDIWYEEYVTSPNNYTLNGFMFALFGLYDWSMVQAPIDNGQRNAKIMFDKGINSLADALPFYDVNGFSSYDLTGIMNKRAPYVTPRYHAIHIYQLYDLYVITKNPVLLKYHKLWASYVE
ncbi:D-glucuronyl C5-epimerase family protein [Neobacillus drentensis]|uniref:D-glucuronyl C5-epimerase family protein n=1 Tax=Neobacillus drentensis TaxID=220684 RepID=UPI0030002241